MQESSEACPETTMLHAWLCGQLDADSKKQLGMHVMSCHACQNRMSEMTEETGFKNIVQRRVNIEPFHLEPEFKLLRERLVKQRAELIRQEKSGTHRAGQESDPTEIETREFRKEGGETVDEVQAKKLPVGQGSIAQFPDSIAPEFQADRMLGQGGFSQVFLAWDKSLGRQVAIKVLDSKHIDARNRQRFFREARTAAKLNDPAILPVYRIDETRSGQPYLVMQYVSGGTLDQKTAARMNSGSLNEDSIEDAIRLLGEIAAGLARVHKAGLVHRDIKPANILLDDSSDPVSAKLADFGLVKYLNSESITLTRAAELVGTPAFMSPEQAQENADVDSRSDIYSLGATLYHSITGQAPFAGSSLAVIRQISDASPVPPRQLNEFVSADLETVCLKAMAKDPARRYQTGLEFANDLERIRDGRPIMAKPVSSFEKLWLWCKRNRALAATLFLLLTSLTVGTIFSTAMWIRSDRNARQAIESDNQSKKRLGQLEKGNEILGSIFADLNIMEIKQKEQSLEAVLSERLLDAVKQIDSEAVGDPAAEAKLQYQLGRSLHSLGYFQEAVPILKKSMETSSRELGEDDVDTLSCMHDLARAYLADGQHGQALPLMQSALNGRKAKLGERHPDTLKTMSDLAATFNAMGRLDDALTLLQQTLELRLATLGPEDTDIAVSKTQLAYAYVKSGQMEKAKPLFEESYQLCLEQLGENHAMTIQSLDRLGTWYAYSGDIAEALPRFERAMNLFKQNFGAEHPQTLSGMNNVAYCYSEQGELKKAISIYERILEIQKKKYGENHPGNLLIMNNLAHSHQRLGDLDIAVSIFEKTLEMRQSQLGDDHPDTLLSMNNLAFAYSQSGATEKSLSMYEDALRMKRDKYGDDHPETQLGAANLGMSYKEEGRLDEALPLLEEASQASKEFANVRWINGELMDAYAEKGMTSEARKLYQDYLQWTSDSVESETLKQMESYTSFANPLLKLELFDEAEAVLLKCVALGEKLQPDNWNRFRVMVMLGAAFTGQNKLDEAQSWLVDGYQGMKSRADDIPATRRDEILSEAVDRLVQWAEASDDAEQLEKWKTEKKSYLSVSDGKE